MSEMRGMIGIIDSRKCFMSDEKEYKRRIAKDRGSVLVFQASLLINKK